MKDYEEGVTSKTTVVLPSHSHRSFSSVTAQLLIKAQNRFNGLLLVTVQGCLKALKRFVKESGIPPPG